MTFDELVTQITPEQIRTLWATYGLGVCVGELSALGRTEDEIRMAFEQAIREQEEAGARVKHGERVARAMREPRGATERCRFCGKDVAQLKSKPRVYCNWTCRNKYRAWRSAS